MNKTPKQIKSSLFTMKKMHLSSLRIDDRTNSHIRQALKKLNEQSVVVISLQEFRRICLEYTSQQILQGIQIKLSQT